MFFKIHFFPEELFVDLITSFFKSGCVVLKCALSFILLMKSFISFMYLNLLYSPRVAQKFRFLLSSLNSLYENIFFDNVS